MEKIKILYAADANGDLAAIKVYSDYIKKVKPDIALLTGNLIYRVFTKKQLEKYAPIINEYEEKKHTLLHAVEEGVQEIGMDEMMKLFPAELWNAIQEFTLEDKSIIELVNETQDGPSTRDLNNLLEQKNQKIPQPLGDAIEPYLNAREEYKEPFKIAKQSMESQYKKIAKIMEGTNCRTLHGNHDGKCLGEIMASLHEKGTIFKDIKIAGYGGAIGMPWGVPEELLERFTDFEGKIPKEDEEIDYKGSKAGAFMIHADPDIAVLYETPLKEDGLKSYVTTEKPYLVLAGHGHKLIGIYDNESDKKLGKNTTLVMPGKLGKIPLLEGGLLEAGGADGKFELVKAPKDTSKLLKTFAEIELTKKVSKDGKSVILTPLNISFKQIKDSKIESYPN